MKNLIQIDERNRSIVQILGQILIPLKRKTLIQCERVDMVKNLKDYFNKLFPDYTNDSSKFIGGMKREDEIEAKEKKFIFSTFDKSGESLDIEGLTILVFVDNPSQFIQPIYRIIRGLNFQYEPLILVFYDSWIHTFYNNYLSLRGFCEKEKFIIENFLIYSDLNNNNQIFYKREGDVEIETSYIQEEKYTTGNKKTWIIKKKRNFIENIQDDKQENNKKKKEEIYCYF